VSVEGHPIGMGFPAGGALDLEGVEVGGFLRVGGLEVGNTGGGRGD
jgi:hypothetical protein